MPEIEPMIRALALLLLLAQAPPSYDPTIAYDKRDIAGFTVYVNRRALWFDTETNEALSLLESKLKEIVRLLPRDKLKPLRRVAFWVEWENDVRGAAVYHPSAEWLKEHGYNPDKARGIEISNVRHFVKWCREDQPMMVLHELAHAYHHTVLGYDNTLIQAAYERALRSGLYDSVPYVHGGKKRAYALNNAQEFFAELSEAYFGRNDFFPYTREKLKQYDPDGYRLMETVWK
jgi:hypothetical protein